MKSNKQLKYSNYVAFSHFHGTAVNNSGVTNKKDKVRAVGVFTLGLFIQILFRGSNIGVKVFIANWHQMGKDSGFMSLGLVIALVA